MDLTGLLHEYGGSMGFGGVAGVAVGYAAKKLTKLVALALGVTVILVQLLAYQGLISVDWGAVQDTAHGVWTDAEGLTLADRAWTVLTANLPFGAAFVGGFALGFKLG